MGDLWEYRRRDPRCPPEPVPAEDPPGGPGGDRFVIQEHHARRLHHDVRFGPPPSSHPAGCCAPIEEPGGKVATGALYQAMELDELADVKHRRRQMMARDETLLHCVRKALCDGVDALEAASDRLGEVLAGRIRHRT